MTDKGEIWYWIIIFLFAPIVVLLIPFAIIAQKKDMEHKERQDAERKEQDIKRKIQEEELQEKINAAQKTYNEIRELSCNEADDYVAVAQKMHRIVNDKRYDLILKYLDAISLPKEFELKIKECTQSGTGDKSKLYIKLPDDSQDFDIFKYLKIEQSCMGAWQAALLHTLWHVLPLWWHANYDSRKYVFSKNDAMMENLNCVVKLAEHKKEKVDIKRCEEVIAEKFNNVNNVAPEVFQKDDKYYVSYCYWTMFVGLIREFIEITIHDNKVKEFFPFEKTTISEFQCGIRF